MQKHTGDLLRITNVHDALKYEIIESTDYITEA